MAGSRPAVTVLQLRQRVASHCGRRVATTAAIGFVALFPSYGLNANALGYWITRWSLSSGSPKARPGGE